MSDIPHYAITKYHEYNSIFTGFNLDFTCTQSLVDYRYSTNCKIGNGDMRGYLHHGLRVAALSNVTAHEITFHGTTPDAGAACKLETGAYGYFSEMDFRNHPAVAIKTDAESKGVFVGCTFGDRHRKAAVVVSGGSTCVLIGCDITGGDIWAYSPTVLIDCSVERKVRYSPNVGPPTIIKPRGVIRVEEK